MNIVTDQPYTVFRNDYNGYTFYKLGISKKSKTGEWINGYLRCQFKNSVSIENKTKIYLRKSWLSFYNKDKETIPYVFIAEYEIADKTINNSKSTEILEKSTDKVTELDPFAEFGAEIVLSDDDLPF